MNDFTLSDIYIGCADGGKEAASTKYDFTDLFYTGNSKYEEIAKSNNYIISGRKGTGKTILAKYLEKMQVNKNIFLKSKYINLTDDIKQHEFIERNYGEIKDDEYMLFPKYYILKVFSEVVLKEKIGFFKYLEYGEGNLIAKVVDFIKYKNYKKKLKSFTSERYPDGNYIGNLYETEVVIGSEAMSTLGIDIANVKGGHRKQQSKKQHSSVKNFSFVLDKCEKYVLSCMKVCQIMLIFDDIDDIKIYIKEQEKVKKFLIGFIKTVDKINLKISELNKNNKCIIIIRDDILDSLNALDSNLNKIIVDSSVNLDWIGNNQTSMLIDMICHKIKKSNKKFSELDEKDILKLFIPVKGGKDMLSKIIERGFGRPRDVILYLSTIINNNKKEKNITFKMLKDAEAEYSNKFWNEIKNELSFYHSETYIDEILKLLSSMGKPVFKYSELENYFESHRDNYKEIDDVRSLVDELYKFGIIGNQTQKNGVSKYFFYYRKDGKLYFDIDENVSIHYGLRKIFNI